MSDIPWRCDDSDLVDPSAQTEQEYDKSGFEMNQNTVSQFVQDVDHSVFDNQNMQYSYHQLPNVWDQVLQVQIPLPRGESHAKGDECLCDMENRQIDLSTSLSQSSAYQNQRQHNPFASNTSQIVDAWPCTNEENEFVNESTQIKESGDAT